MAKINLKAKTREIVGKKVAGLREQGLIPAVVYGPGLASLNIAVLQSEFKKLYDTAGQSQVIALDLDEGKEVRTVLVKDIQKEPVHGLVTHVDFYDFKEGQSIIAKVNIKFVGEAAPVKEAGASLVKNLDQVEIKCLPEDMVTEIEVDLGKIKKMDDIIRVKDLVVPPNMQIVNKLDEVIAGVTMEAVEAAVPAAPAAVAEAPKEETKNQK